MRQGQTKANGSGAQQAAGAAKIAIPAAGQVVEIAAAAASSDDFVRLARDTGAQIVVTASGRLALLLPNGGQLIFAWTGDFVDALGHARNSFLQRLNGDLPMLGAVLDLSAGRALRQGSLLEQTAGEIDTVPDAGADRGILRDGPQLREAGTAAAGGLPPAILGGVAAVLPPPLGSPLDPLGGIGDETRRWGRDDLKRGEFGATGETLRTPVGSALGHLVGLGDEEIGHRNGEKFTSSDNLRFPGQTTGVGSGIDHLWLLGDFEYARASIDAVDDESPEIATSAFRVAPPPLTAAPYVFAGVEDTPLTGRIFDPVTAVLPVTERAVSVDPAAGTAVLNADGTLVFAPTNGFSGTTTLTFTLTDPRTGRPETGTIELTVAAVVDMPTVTGGAGTGEDTAVAVPVTVTLGDPDGSEVIESAVVTGVPSGATLTWDTSLPGTVAVLGGAVVVTGSTTEIRGILESLVFTPPADFSGTVTLNVAVTVTEANLPTTLPGYGDTTTIDYPLVIDVRAIADTVAVTGDIDEVTPEDTAVRLDDLTAAFGDLLDGSETHTIEIRGVAADVRLTDTAGTEYPFTLAADGSKTYAVSQAQLGDIWFAPPANASGTFTGMTIVATATEPNGDTQTATAPIVVVVTPVADIVTIATAAVATDEDTAVSFGGDISITINDPLSETLTSVVVSGFPPGTVVTYTGVGGAPVTLVVPAGGASVTLTGGSEADIRTALTTLTLTAPPDSDANITLTIAATATDTGGVSRTDTAPLVVTVNAVADAPVIAGAASGLEDQPVALPITLSRADTDGSESYESVILAIPAGVTLLLPVTLPDGITVSIAGNVYSFAPGAGTTPAQLESFLATGLTVAAGPHVSATFSVTVTATTIESRPTETGEVTLLRNATTTSVPIVIAPVNDLPAISGASAVDEDATVVFGGNVIIPVLADADGSERISAIAIANFPAGVTPTWTLVGTAAVTVSAGTYTIAGGSEADIRATLATFALTPPDDSDANIPLTIRVSTTDNGVIATTAPATHIITVNAVADAPSLSGAAAGLEDTAFALPITTALNDTDGSESFDYARLTVPAGLVLTYPASLPDGITVAVAGNVVTFTPGAATTSAQFAGFLATGLAVQGTPTHSDADFVVRVVVGSIESTLTDSGLTLLRNSTVVDVPVTVTAVADGVTASGASVIVEDIAATIGTDIAWSKIDGDGSEHVTRVELSGFPAGSTVTYTPVGGGALASVAILAVSDVIALSGGSEAQIRAALDTLAVTAPVNSDSNFAVAVAVTTTDNDASSKVDSYSHSVVVQAVADAPSVAAAAISGSEDTLIALSIDANRSADADGSEVLSVRITLPSTGGALIGTIALQSAGSLIVGATVAGVTTVTGAPAGDVTVTDLGAGVYLVTGPASGTSTQREAAIDAVLQGGVLNLQPRAQWSGVLAGASGIRVDAISTEAAVAGELAPVGYGGADGTSKTETVTTYVGVTVAPVADLPVLANASTVVQENAGSSALADPDLVVALGNRLGLTIADTDGSQGLSLSLAGLPTNLQAAAFASPIAGVATTINLAAGTIALSGASANDVLAVLQSLSITLADDRDQNFSVAISGTMSDTNGASTVNTPFALTHDVTVQAVADAPTVNVGAATKATVSEDSGFVTYAVSVALNDTDGSESYQSVVVDVATAGSGARPLVQFTTMTGVTFDTATPGRVILTGSAANIEAAMASLQVRPGADNGENITVSVTATAVESLPAEDNNGAAAGIGGGVAGPEIAVPTAQTVQSFVIPVTPIPEVPVLVAPASTIGLEDIKNTIAAISIAGTLDPDGSEQRFVEINTASFPAGTTFWNGATQQTTAVGGWLRIPETDLASLAIQAPSNYSGVFTLSIRVTVVDTTSTTSTTTSQPPQNLSVRIDPVADTLRTPSRSIGYEDLAVAFGTDLASAATGIRVSDTTVGSAGNGGVETVSQVVLTVPANTTALTYAMSGTYVPPVTGTLAGSGSAQVVYDAATRTYTITSTIITGAASVPALTNAQRTQADTDIRATLQTFQVRMGQDRDANGSDDGDQDQNGAIQVSATSLDVKNGVASTLVTAFTHTVAIMARADTPAITAGFAVTGAESGSTVSRIALTGAGGQKIVVNRSSDTDGVSDSAGWGSERMSVTVTGLPPLATIGVIASYTLPAGASITGSAGGTYTINAANEDQLNQVLSNLSLTSPNYSGPATLTVTAITTEAGQAGDPNTGLGAGIDVRTATALATINLTITPTVDTPTVKGNAIGLEDTHIPVPLSVTLGDKDGSETFVVRITAASVPAGATLFGAGGAALVAAAGYYTLTAADIPVLAIQAPLNWSSPLQGNITLVTQTTVSDGAAVPVIFTNNIVVTVQGDADTPRNYPVTVAAQEDVPYAIGAAIVAAAGGSLNNALVDADGSEVLSFVISGLPSGVIPTSSTGAVTFIGGGQWQVDAAAIPTLVLPAVRDYAGNNPYPAMSLRAISQEIDSDQATSLPWPVTFTVAPVIDAATVDGFASWAPDITRTETQVEVSGVSLGSIANHAYADSDGSETVLVYKISLASLVADAQIGGRLASLGAAPTLDGLIAGGYLQGTYAYHATAGSIMVGGVAFAVEAGTITVAPADMAGVRLAAALFLDSNVDFALPVAALLEDTAGGPRKVETTSFDVTITGVADVPTVFARNPDNDGNAADVDVFAPLADVPLVFGGLTTDIDADNPATPAPADGLGRVASEQVYYILRLASTSGGPAPQYVLLNATTGNVAGFDNGDGTWLVRQSDLGNLVLRTADFSGAPVTLNFEVTSVAVDDGTLAQNAAAATFAFVVDPGTGGITGAPPPAPTINLLNLLPGTEDTTGALSAAASPVIAAGPGTASVAVMFTVPTGASVTGAIWNPVTSRWVASATDFNNGTVRITPPADFSGNLAIQVEAVATGTNLVKNSTGVRTISIPVDPVADGVTITASPGAGVEDLPVNLNIALALRDTNGTRPGENAAEVLGAPVTLSGQPSPLGGGPFAYVRLGSGAALIGAYTAVAAGDSDATLDNNPTAAVGAQSLVGWYRVPVTSLAALQMRGAANWHGPVTVEVAALSRESADNSDGDNTLLNVASFQVTLVADADAPAIPGSVATAAGNEDTAIAIAGLSAALVDTVTANGGELLSVKISGVPDGTRFSAGSNNGDGSWTIPTAALAALTITPPLHYAGTMALTMTAFALESSNGDTATSSVTFNVAVTPLADTFEILAQNVSVDPSGAAAMSLNIRMADATGATPGEQAPEVIRLTFTSVPTGMFLTAGLGGRIVDVGAGQWTFNGSEAQANALGIASGTGATAGTYSVNISAVSIDGASTLATPITDNFQLVVTAPTNAGTTLTGTAAGEALTGGAGHDFLSGLAGNDTLSGGAGIDRLIGGTGADSMTGGTGADSFIWRAGDASGGTDAITDFTNGAGGDALDLSALLTGFDLQSSALSDFVRLKADGRTIQIDANGATGGASFADLVILQGASGLDLNAMRANGNLIV